MRSAHYPRAPERKADCGGAVDGEDIVELLQHISYTGDGEGGAA